MRRALFMAIGLTLVLGGIASAGGEGGIQADNPFGGQSSNRSTVGLPNLFGPDDILQAYDGDLGPTLDVLMEELEADLRSRPVSDGPESVYPGFRNNGRPRLFRQRQASIDDVIVNLSRSTNSWTPATPPGEPFAPPPDGLPVTSGSFQIIVFNEDGSVRSVTADVGRADGALDDIPRPALHAGRTSEKTSYGLFEIYDSCPVPGSDAIIVPPAMDGVCPGTVRIEELPVTQSIFVDGFESGDTSAWSDWQASR